MPADPPPTTAETGPIREVATPTPRNSNPNPHVGSRAGSPSGTQSRGPHEVRFGTGVLDPSGKRTPFDLRDTNPQGNSPEPKRPASSVTAPVSLDSIDAQSCPESLGSISDISGLAVLEPSVNAPPWSSKYRTPRIEEDEKMDEKDSLVVSQGVAALVKPGLGGSYSVPNSVCSSPTLNSFSVGAGQAQGAVAVDYIPLLNIGGGQPPTGGNKDETTELEKPKLLATREAHDLVRKHTRGGGQHLPSRFREDMVEPGSNELASGYTTPMSHNHADYVKKPGQFRGGILSTLLTLYNPLNGHETRCGHHNASSSLPGSGRSTPKWYAKSANTSTSSLGGLLAASASSVVAPTAGVAGSSNVSVMIDRPRPKHRPHSGGIFDKLKNLSRPSLEDEIRITIHIAETLQLQRYIIKICRALMLYGAPTHRLEEALKMTSRVLEIDAQFLYIPGCMIISFGDQSTHTSDMQIVRTAQGVDLGKLHDCHIVYKEVVHDIISVEVATQRLDEIMERNLKHGPWLRVLIYGVASATVGPFGFKARFIDMPILLVLGCLLGFLQLIVAPRSELYANVFEISATILTSFLARAFGSIRGGSLFCFSALTQGSIALILPGYIILCGSLELQSKNIVAGSVRMFYAIIYSLFLGFGVTIGSALYGLLDSNATSATTCEGPLDWRYNFIFVPLFTVCLLTISQARWRQAPVMIAIALAAYVVNYFSGLRFSGQPQIANGLGAFTIGVLGNLYARLGHGLAFAAMLPAIFVQVPSGLAAQGSLVSGIENADAIVSNSTSMTTSQTNSIMFEFGFSMVQVAIGITVGLFAATLVVYPFGKKRSGLFSF